MTSTDKIYGLVLSGGKSTRMGEDKGLISYHGIPQREHMYRTLEEVCDESFMSVRSDQEETLDTSFNLIIDEDRFRGPLNGILSAHLKYPEAAWLVVACDMPLLTAEALRELIRARNLEKTATAYALKGSELPEPLCAIWEPEGLRKAVAYLDAGNGTCARKYLLRSDIHLVHPREDKVLVNANSKEDYREILSKHL